MESKLTTGRDTGYGHPSGDDSIPADLERLDNLDGWELAEGEPDPRGYELVGQDGERIGTIEDLLASPSTEKVYFAVVDTGSHLQGKRRLVPLRYLEFDTGAGRAYGPFVGDQFAGAPDYVEGDREFGPCYNYWSGLAVADSPEGMIGGVRERYAGPEAKTGRPAEATAAGVGAPPAAETAGEVRVPVVEEEVVVRKRPRVVRELILRAVPVVERVEQDVEVRHEEVEVIEEGDVDVEPSRRAR